MYYGSGTANVGGNENLSIDQFVGKAREGNIPVFLCSQHWGVVDPRGYETTVALVEAGIVPLFDMTPSMAWVKLLWVLENPHPPGKPSEIVKRMLENVAGEIMPLSSDEIGSYTAMYQ